jgi:sec-independent protein translocase protein TatB
MLNIGLGEILLIGCLLLVVVGPERLPKMLRVAGRYYAKLRRAANELQSAFMDEGDLLDAGLDPSPSAASPSGLPAHKPVRPKSQLDEQRVPADPAAAIAAAQSKRAEVLAEAEQTIQDVELEPAADGTDEPVERAETKRPVDVASLPLDESQGDW